MPEPVSCNRCGYRPMLYIKIGKDEYEELCPKCDINKVTTFE